MPRHKQAMNVKHVFHQKLLCALSDLVVLKILVFKKLQNCHLNLGLRDKTSNVRSSLCQRSVQRQEVHI